MTTSPRFSVVPVGMSVGIFFVITYLLCVAYGLVGSAPRMHELISMLIPGFTWISWGSFLTGLVWAFGYGWYVALVLVPLHNFFAGRSPK